MGVPLGYVLNAGVQMSFTIDLTGKKAFVTGGTRGIGLQIATKLALSGCDLALGYKGDTKSAELAVKSIQSLAPNCNVFTVQGDLGIDKSARSLANDAAGILGGNVDIVVLNAAVGGGGELAEIPIQDWRAPFETNVFGHVAVLQELADKIRAGGSVVFISSGAGHDPLAGLSAYGASKAAVNQVATILAQEWGPRGIRVNVVSPGHTAKQSVDYSNLTDSQKSTIEGTALRRIGTPDDVAGAVLFFASELSSFVTGQWIRVNGGRV
jgi:NAD(P)-dependent dehydrogenase (short-subunit alcohol dehydrogenase family)